MLLLHADHPTLNNGILKNSDPMKIILLWSVNLSEQICHERCFATVFSRGRICRITVKYAKDTVSGEKTKAVCWFYQGASQDGIMGSSTGGATGRWKKRFDLLLLDESYYTWNKVELFSWRYCGVLQARCVIESCDHISRVFIVCK